MLETLDLGVSLTREELSARRPNFDREMFDLLRRAKAGGVPVVVIFEGTELAGKGQAIYTLTEKLDPRLVSVHPTTRARKFERERPWLWRFWMKLPPRGEVAVFDESWYRRVLTERFEGDVKKREWKAAFDEIANLEKALVDDGTVLVKLFLHVDARTQKKRLRRVEKRGLPVHRSWRAQQRRFAAWEDMVEEMLEKTSTVEAPWTLVPAQCSRFARAKVFETVIRELRRALDDRGVPAAPVATAAAPAAPGATPVAEAARS